MCCKQDERRVPSSITEGPGSNFVIPASWGLWLVGAVLCVGVWPAGDERLGVGVVASAVLFDLVDVGEHCGHRGGVSGVSHSS
jgi:hypothetical protein